MSVLSKLSTDVWPRINAYEEAIRAGTSGNDLIQLRKDLFQQAKEAAGPQVDAEAYFDFWCNRVETNNLNPDQWAAKGIGSN